MKRKNLLIGLAITAVGFAAFMFYSNSGEVDEALHPTKQYASWAFILGGLSAISLLIGSICGVLFNPRPSITASLTAFGAGALLAALSVELIAPTVADIVAHGHDGNPGDKSHALYTMGALLGGCIFGGILFVTLDEMLSNKGAFMRKASTMINFLRHKPSSNIDKHLKNEIHHILEHEEMKEEVKEHGGAPMSIWLGLLIDGIPESFIIGAGFLTLLTVQINAGAEVAFANVVPYTLIAGLFLSNFPEALSSSIGMRKQGMSVGKILLLWGSLVLITAIGAVFGYFLGSEIPHELQIGVEGLAAGAMLTMIAQTMIPEAVHIGGNKVVGLSVLGGYLSAVAFKLLE